MFIGDGAGRAENGLLRGLVGTGGVTVQALSDADLTVGLASEITSVTRVAPTNKLLTVVGTLHVEAGSSLPGSLPRIALAQDGTVLWGMAASSTQFSIGSTRSNSAYMNLASVADLNGLLASGQAEVKWNSPSPLRLQGSAGATAITINPNGTADVVVNQLLAPDGAQLMSVAGQGSAASLVTGRLNAASVITSDLSLRGSQTSITLENNNGPTIALSALTGGGFEIQQNLYLIHP